MKKIITILCFLYLISPAWADSNIMFGEKQNSSAFYIAQSTGSGTLFKLINPGIWDFHPQTLFLAQYSQPTTFFRLDSRLNFNLVGNTGYNSSKNLGFVGIGISLDTALFQYHDWYTGIGIGPYMRDKPDRWVESRLVFGEKFFIGKNIDENWYMEFFTIHFSNGNFTNVNKGFNFAGFSIGRKF